VSEVEAQLGRQARQALQAGGRRLILGVRRDGKYRSGKASTE